MGEAKIKLIAKSALYNERMRSLDMPPQIAALPVSSEGWPTPWFAAWFDDNGREAPIGQGRPDFRVVGSDRVARAIRKQLCWVCGQPLGRPPIAVAIGPMCSVNKISSEPPSHVACARFSVRACPFLTRPRMKRNERDLPVKIGDTPGIAIGRNPGVTALWVTSQVSYNPKIRLFHVGEPERIEWWSQGRTATREEIMDSIQSGLVFLRRACDDEDTPEMRAEAHALLDHQLGLALELVPA